MEVLKDLEARWSTTCTGLLIKIECSSQEKLHIQGEGRKIPFKVEASRCRMVQHQGWSSLCLHEAQLHICGGPLGEKAQEKFREGTSKGSRHSEDFSKSSGA